MATYQFTTGQAALPDVGVMAYNGCTFGPYTVTNISGEAVKDNAQRTIKWMEYTLTVDGFVTLNQPGAQSIDANMAQMLLLLNQPAGILTYTGRGFANFIINQTGGRTDVAWGPMPETIEFIPLGGGLSAQVKWVVKVRVPVLSQGPQRGALAPVLQFNEETVVTFNDDQYTRLMVRGTLEIAITRTTVNNRTVTRTVDDYRTVFLGTIVTAGQGGIDLTRFRIVNREVSISRDKRTMEWSFVADELPHMPIPLGCTLARGEYTVEPTKTGPALVRWNCGLTCTYTYSQLYMLRVAWWSFLSMWQWRMIQSVAGVVPSVAPGANNQNTVPPGARVYASLALPAFVVPINAGASFYNAWRRTQNQTAATRQNEQRAIVVNFRVREGLYLDSKSITFSANWIICTNLAGILIASGVWTKPPSLTDRFWADSALQFSGPNSWLTGRLDARQDVIVDFGGGG